MSAKVTGGPGRRHAWQPWTRHMPIYHFNIHDGTSHPDPDGHELADIEAAKREAVSLSGNLIREMGSEFWDGEGWTMEVSDHTGLILFALYFSASMSPASMAP
jgi:hypothetical protein